MTLCNADPHRPAQITCQTGGEVPQQVHTMTLTAQSIDAHNDFEAPSLGQPQKLEETAIAGGTLTITLPPMSVTTLFLSSSIGK